MKVIIISGGNPPSQQLLMNEITEDAFLIGADSVLIVYMTII